MMRNTLIILLYFLVNFVPCQTQYGRVKKYTTPKSGEVILKDVPDKYSVQIYNLELPDPEVGADHKRLQEIKEQLQQKNAGHKHITERKTTSVPAPVVNISYTADSFAGVPPDNYTAVSNENMAVSVMNDRISVHNAGTGSMLIRKTLETFSASLGFSDRINDYRFDPKVVYDPVADKYICIMLNGINQYNYIIIGFSKTNDPGGAWTLYKFYGDYTGDTTWFDYPNISITQNEVFFTGNKIKYDSTWQAGFKESVIYQVRKEDGYNGASALTYQIWDSVKYHNGYLRCLYPLNPGNMLQGPAQYFLSNRDFDIANDTVFLVEVPDTIGSSDTMLTIKAIVSGSSYGVPPDARQPDTSLTLATNDGRILGGFIAGSEVQFVSTTSDTTYGTSAIYHGIISNFTTTPVLAGQVISIDTLDMGYPNISYAGNSGGINQSIISFDYTGPQTYPGYGAIFFDGSGYSPMQIIKAGDSTINRLPGKQQRWGDYSGSQPQWNAPGVVWVAGIYGRKDHSYGNYMAQLRSPYFTDIPSVSAAPSIPANIFPNPACEFTRLEFYVVADQVFGFGIYDMQGRLVDNLANKFCQAGKNIIEFNVAPLLPGTYILKAKGNKGENIQAHTLVRR